MPKYKKPKADPTAVLMVDQVTGKVIGGYTIRPVKNQYAAKKKAIASGVNRALRDGKQVLNTMVCNESVKIFVN